MIELEELKRRNRTIDFDEQIGRRYGFVYELQTQSLDESRILTDSIAAITVYKQEMGYDTDYSEEELYYSEFPSMTTGWYKTRVASKIKYNDIRKILKKKKCVFTLRLYATCAID